MIKAGQKVKILPEWCDCKEEELTEYLVIHGEEEGKPRITIQFDLDMVIQPTQVVQTYMVAVV